MFKWLYLLMEPLRTPMLYRRRLGSGRTVSVVVADNGFELKDLMVRFERKIEQEDVANGQLKPVSLEEVKKRGGKRSTTISLSYESAEALNSVLKTALKDARRRRIWHDFSTRVIQLASSDGL